MNPSQGSPQFNGRVSEREEFVKKKSLAALLIATVFLTAVGLATWTSPAAAQAPAAPEAREAAGISLDEQLLAVGKQDPSFGGMFFDEDGRMNIYVLESALAAQSGAAQIANMSVAIEAAFRGHPMLEAASTQRVQVLPAQFAFTQLYSWNEAATQSVLDLTGVVYTDIAEERNRLRIGVETEALASAVRERLANAGVPAEAVLIEQAAPIRQMVTLRSRFRPLVGGIQINFGNFLCTLGFLAIRAGVPGFVTNSHCTTIQGGVNNTIFHQPTAVGIANRVGLEIRDPFYFVGGVCPAGRRCRYSDTAYVRVPHPGGPAVGMLRGAIARPIALGSITTALPHYRITSENNVPFLNELLNKVGRTTGWSRGTVRRTCVNTNVSGTNITQLCQDFVAANVAGGDSGSPVFRITGAPNVRLYGILWGGGTLPGVGTVFVFSALGPRNVQRAAEMGPLTTCAAGFGC